MNYTVNVMDSDTLDRVVKDSGLFPEDWWFVEAHEASNDSKYGFLVDAKAREVGEFNSGKYPIEEFYHPSSVLNILGSKGLVPLGTILIAVGW